jgi:hypothetical protein
MCILYTLDVQLARKLRVFTRSGWVVQRPPPLARSAADSGVGSNMGPPFLHPVLLLWVLVLLCAFGESKSVKLRQVFGGIFLFILLGLRDIRNGWGLTDLEWSLKGGPATSISGLHVENVKLQILIPNFRGRIPLRRILILKHGHIDVAGVELRYIQIYREYYAVKEIASLCDNLGT